jgi:glycosyltransferase involved in cell wall biosynthesis
LRRLRLAVWTPLPPSPSGIADYAQEQLAVLGERFDLCVVERAPDGPRPDADLDLYQVGNSPAHGFVYRAALERPGVVLLHDDGLHDLVRSETLARGERGAYLQALRRAHGERGSFLGRQIARGLGGELWPALLPLDEPLLESSLGVVALTRAIAERVFRRLPGRPVLHLPHHLSLPLVPWPDRAEARRALGLPADALLVTAPGLASAAKRLDAVARVVSRLQADHPRLRLVIAGGVDPGFDLAGAIAGGAPPLVTGRLSLEDFLRHLAAADVVAALRFPSRGEISGALVRALGAGRAALVTAGTPAEGEFPEGCVAPVSPDREESELLAVLGQLLADAALREALGAAARAFVRERHELGRVTSALADFLDHVAERAPELRRGVRPQEHGTLGALLDEVHFAARDLGLPKAPEDVRGLFSPLCARP